MLVIVVCCIFFLSLVNMIKFIGILCFTIMDDRFIIIKMGDKIQGRGKEENLTSL